MPERSVEATPARIDELAENLEKRKRQILEKTMRELVPDMAKQDKELARNLAEQTLEEIQQGNNKDLEPEFRQIMKENGIEL